MNKTRNLIALLLCALMLLGTPLMAFANAKYSNSATFTIDTVQEADLVAVNILLAEPNTYIGAIQLQFDYDETYLEIVTNPETGKYFSCPYDPEKVIWAGNEENMKFALATADGIKEAGVFLTLCFRVIRDIPANTLANITGWIDLEPVNCMDSNHVYATSVINGGVMGTSEKPTNKLFTNQRTGIEAVAPKEDAIADANFKTRLHGWGGNEVVYDIGFNKNGQEVQPDGKVVVRIPLPEGYNGDTCTVYHTEEDGTKTEMKALLHNDYFVLETDSFSEYSVVDSTRPAGEFVTAPALGYGDLNDDGISNANDALMILKAAVEKLQLNSDQAKAAEVNQDSAIDAKDALLVLQVAVLKIEKFPVEQ